MSQLKNPAHGALVLRLALGVMMVAHGWLKVSVFTVAGTVGFFESVGFPGWLAYVTIAAELGGGLALITGLYTRWVALAIIPILLGAASVHWGNGWVFSNANGGWEYPVFLAAAALAQVFLGSGSYALTFNRNRGLHVAHAV
ncbi:MAG: DoxX family protein [Magnetospiraceae bacterium]